MKTLERELNHEDNFLEIARGQSGLFKYRRVLERADKKSLRGLGNKVPINGLIIRLRRDLHQEKERSQKIKGGI